MAKNVISDEERLKAFLFTAKEYIRFSDYFKQKDKTESTDGDMHISTQTRLIILRKYFSKNELTYIPTVIRSAKNMYPGRAQYFDEINDKFCSIVNGPEVIALCDGSIQTLYKTIEDVIYGVYLHSDLSRIANLMTTDSIVYEIECSKFTEAIDSLLMNLFTEVSDDYKVDNVKQKEKAAVIFPEGKSKNDEQITDAPFWSNLSGHNPKAEENTIINLSETDFSVLYVGTNFIHEIQKDDYSVKALKKLVFPPTKSAWGNFSKVHNLVCGIDFGVSSHVEYNNEKTMAYVVLLKNVPKNSKGFILDDFQQITDAITLTLVHDDEKSGWRVFAIGDKVDNYKRKNMRIGLFHRKK